MRLTTGRTVRASLAITVIVPATAFADDCSYTDPTDCYNQLLIALIAIAAIALLIAIAWELIPFLAAAVLDAPVVIGEGAAVSGEAAAADLAGLAQRLVLRVATDMLGGAPAADALQPAAQLAASAEGRAVLRAAAVIAGSLLINPPPELTQEMVGPLQVMLEWFQRFGVEPW